MAMIVHMPRQFSFFPFLLDQDQPVGAFLARARVAEQARCVTECLDYLVMCAQDQRLSPVTEAQHRTILQARKWNNLTIRNLLACLVLNSLLLPIGLPTLYTSDDQASRLTFTLLILAIQVLGVAMSYWSTGFAPHYAAMANDDAQNACEEAAEMYDALGKHLHTVWEAGGHEERARVQELCRQVVESRPELLKRVRELVPAADRRLERALTHFLHVAAQIADLSAQGLRVSAV